MVITPHLSQRITNLTTLATMAILFMHLSESGVTPGSVYQFFDTFTRLAVPLFFLISGFLLAQRCEQIGWYATAIRKRFKSLVIPYFLLNSLMIPMLVFYQNILKAGNWAPGGVSFNWYSISRIYGLTYKFHPAIGTMWYVRCLVFFVLLSPLMVYIIRRSRAATGLLLVMLYAVVTGVENLSLGEQWGHVFYSFFSLRGLFFFSLGISLAYWGRDLQGCLRWCMAAACWIVGLVFWYCGDYSLFSNEGLFTWMLLIGAIILSMPAVTFPRWMTGSCFALFALHQLVYKVFAVGIARCGFTSAFTDNPLVLLPLFTACAVIFVLTYILRRYCPRVGEIAFGGRC